MPPIIGGPSRLLRAVLATVPLLGLTPALAHWPDQPAHQFADLGEF